MHRKWNVLFQVNFIETPTELDGWCCVNEKKKDVDCYRIHCTERKKKYTKTICRERNFFSKLSWKPMSNLAETIQKNDFQNSHTFHFEMGFFISVLIVYQTHKTYFYHQFWADNCFVDVQQFQTTSHFFFFFFSLLCCCLSRFHLVCLSFFFFPNGNKQWESKGIRCLTHFRAAPHQTNTHTNHFDESIFLFWFQEHHLFSLHENNKNNKKQFKQ